YSNPNRERLLDVVIPFGFALFLWLAFYCTNIVFTNYADAINNINTLIGGGKGSVFHAPIKPLLTCMLYIFIMLVVVKHYKRPIRFSLIILALITMVPVANSIEGGRPNGILIYAERNFFGVNRVLKWEPLNAILLLHGTTTHGMQAIDKDERLKPVSYY